MQKRDHRRGEAAVAILLASVSLLGIGLATNRAAAQTPLPDAAALIQQQETRLGVGKGTVFLDRPSRLGGNVTLDVGHALQIRAPLTVAAGSIQLSGKNDVSCKAPITVENATDLFVADGATDLSVRGCQVTVAGRSGGYLLTATRGQRITATDNHLTKIAIFNTHNIGGPASQTTDVTLTNNSTDFPPGTGPIGIYLLYVIRGTISNNRLSGTGHGIQWWGGDANQGWRSFDAVTGAGDLTITGNQCHIAGGSCVWGSDGFDIKVTGNTADTCSDVCFDTEGGVRTTFSGNSAKQCANGCYAAEFESLNATFTANQGSWDGSAPGGVLVLIKHPSGRGPSHTNLVVTGNTFTCSKICAAFYSEGEDGLTLTKNTINNGFVQFINYTNNVTISGNTLRFTLPVGAQAAITGPALVNGHKSDISGNLITAAAGAVGNAACIAQGWSDYNSTDEMRITGNTCSGFRYGIVTASGGGNPGAPHAVWYLQGNQFANVPAEHQIVHQHSSGNEVYTSAPGPAGR